MAAAGVAGMGLERSGVSRRAGQRWAQGGADHVGPSRPFKNIGSPPPNELGSHWRMWAEVWYDLAYDGVVR